MRTLVFYHSADHDGKSSCAIVKYRFPDALLYPINYGDEFPWAKIKSTDTVFVVDFCLEPFDNMIELNSKCNLIWIDHHISAITNYRSSGVEIEGIRDVFRAGCQLTWDYLFTIPRPTVIELLGNYDIFNLSDEVLTFEYGMRGEDASPKRTNYWKYLLENNLSEISRIRTNGESIRRYVELTQAEIVNKLTYSTTFEGYKTGVLNSPRTSSLAFDKLTNRDHFDIFAVYVFDGSRYNVSLYSNKDSVDVSKIATKYGGGGHAGASGFSAEKLPF